MLMNDMSKLSSKSQNEDKSENMKDIYRIAFDTFDKDKDGIINIDECNDVFKSLGYNLSQNEIEDLIFQARKREKINNKMNNNFVTTIITNNININNNITITLKQFLAIMNTWKKERDVAEEYCEAFRVFDFKDTGRIDIETLKTILYEYLPDIPNDDIDYMLNDADVNEDGTIDYRNFINLLLNK